MMRWLSLSSLLFLLPNAALAQPPSMGPASDGGLVERFRTVCPLETFSARPSQDRGTDHPMDAGSRGRPGGKGDIDYLLNHDKLAEAQNLMAEGGWEQATSDLCEALHYRYEAFGLSDLRTLAAVNDFGVMLRKSGRGSEARAMLEDGIVFTNGLKMSGDPLHDRPLVRAKYNMRLNLASALYEQGFYAGSVEILDRLVDPMAGRQALDEDNRNVAETNLGLALGALGRLADAEIHLRKSLNARLEDDPTGQGVAASMTNLGADLSAQARLAEGETLLRRGRKLRADMFGVDHLNTAFSDVHLASNLIAQGRYSEALPFALEAYSARQSQLPPLHPDRTISLAVVGNAQLGAGDVAGALAAAREAVKAQLSHGALEPGQAKVSPLASPLRRFEDPQRLLVRSGWSSLPAGAHAWRSGSVPAVVNEAFVAGQRLTWSSVGDAVAQAAARRVAGERGLGELAARIETLRGSVEQIDAAVASVAGSDQSANDKTLSVLSAKRDEARHQLDTLAGELKTRFPAFFAYLNPEPIELGTLQDLIKPDEVVIFITPGQDTENGFVWAVTHDQVGWAALPLSGEALARSIRHLRLVIDPKGARSPDSGVDAALTAGARGYDRSSAFTIYTQLFGDPSIAPLVEGATRWLVVPQGEVVSLPLAALVTQKPVGGRDGDVDPASLRHTHWLAFEHEISLLPTVSSLASLRSTQVSQETGRLPFFGLGDPIFQGSGDPPKQVGAYFSDSDVRLAELRKLAPLPGTRTEIGTLAHILGGGPDDVLLGADASETKLSARPPMHGLERYEILAFATHGLVTGNLANTLAEPALALTPPAVATTTDDGLLTASEASLLRLNADWVLLSACNSAAGGSSEADGLTGLARAFILAGARAVLVSHWRVRDDTAPRITGGTITLMHTKKMSRSKALQSAMQSLMMDDSLDATGSSFAAPSAWAAFSLVGID